MFLMMCAPGHASTPIGKEASSRVQVPTLVPPEGQPRRQRPRFNDRGGGSWCQVADLSCTPWVRHPALTRRPWLPRTLQNGRRQSRGAFSLNLLFGPLKRLKTPACANFERAPCRIRAYRRAALWRVARRACDLTAISFSDPGS